MQKAVSINQVSKSYKDVQALNNVDFSIEQGEFFGLLGPNGAGKSTLISALAGLLRVDSGSLEVMGFDVQKDYRQARKAIGVVPQEITFDPFFSVEEALNFQSGYFGLRDNKKWVNELIEELSLADKKNANVRQLSGGMKRRLLIAQALVHKPSVLVLDEPTAGVDVELRQSMWRFIRRLHAQGTTVVLTTHYLEEAEELCDRIGIIDEGELIALEDKQAILDKGFGSKLQIRTDNELVIIPDGLKDKVVSLKDNEVELALVRGKDSVMDILDAVRASGNTISAVTNLSDSLEDVFVQLTGSGADSTRMNSKVDS